MFRTRYLALVSVLTFTAAAQAVIINVPDPIPTIQLAIDLAVDGDEVVIAEGTYVESIDFLGKAITVRSTDPTNPAVVAATIVTSAGGRTVTCDNAVGMGHSASLRYVFTGKRSSAAGITLRGSNRMSRRTEPGEDRREQEGRSRRLSMPSMEADAACGDPRRANAGSFC